MFVDKPPVQVAQSTIMPSAKLTKLLPKTFSSFRVISATLDIVTVEEYGNHNNPSIGRVTLLQCIAQENGGSDRESEMLSASTRWSGDESDGNSTRMIEEFPVWHIVQHVRTVKRMK